MDLNYPEEGNYFIGIFNNEEHILGRIKDVTDELAHFELLINKADIVGIEEENPFVKFNTGFAEALVYGRENILKEIFETFTEE